MASEAKMKMKCWEEDRDSIEDDDWKLKCQQKVDKYAAQFVTFFDKFKYWAERKGLSTEDMVLPFPIL